MANRIDTAAGRRKLEPRRNPYYLAIPDIEGAYVGFRRGPDTWIARLREDGKQIFHALGRHEDHRAAIRAAKEWIKSRQQGVVDHTAAVKDACLAYLANLEREKGPSAAQEARARLQRRVLGRTLKTRQIEAHTLARVPLAKLRPDHVEQWRDGLVPADLKGEALRKAKASANREMAALIAALNHAYKRRLVASDLAWHSIGKFGDVQARKHRRYVTVDERNALLKSAAKVGKGAIRDLLEGLMLTGARPIELARANVADYDTAAGTLALTSYKGPSREPRVREVPLRALGAEALIKRLSKDKLPAAPVFTRDDGQRWGHSDWDDLVRDARDRAELKGITAYDLRHSFISEALTGGVDALTVARIAGTSMEMISATYGKLIEDHATRAFANVRLV